jgi:alkanesulfonate monooxygenase SsuD/methylene tetrahydromethanopterin reductase-like flavin-dependent oxidoreductase (luciferase family)
VQVRRRTLHFGVHVQGQRTNWGEYVRSVQAVEDLGYGSIWTFDHLLPFSGDVDGSCFETLTTLGALCVSTTRVRLGTLVHGVVYRQPAVLAKALAQADHMSGGRVECSLGAGWAEREFHAYGMEFPSLTERYARLEEAMQLVKLLWTEPRVTFRGRYYNAENAPCEPKPLQRPHPQVTVGGTGLGSLRVAARHADRLNVIASPEKCRQLVSTLRRLCEDVGRDINDIELSIHTTLALALSHEGAEQLAERIAASHQVDLSALRATWLIGTPSAVTAQLRRYTDVGISHFVFALGYPFEMEPLRLFWDEVFPSLA